MSAVTSARRIATARWGGGMRLGSVSRCGPIEARWVTSTPGLSSACQNAADSAARRTWHHSAQGPPGPGPGLKIIESQPAIGTGSGDDACHWVARWPGPGGDGAGSQVASALSCGGRLGAPSQAAARDHGALGEGAGSLGMRGDSRRGQPRPTVLRPFKRRLTTLAESQRHGPPAGDCEARSLFKLSGPRRSSRVFCWQLRSERTKPR